VELGKHLTGWGSAGVQKGQGQQSGGQVQAGIKYTW
jgi:outer membrane autotransporter protein